MSNRPLLSETVVSSPPYQLTRAKKTSRSTSRAGVWILASGRTRPDAPTGCRRFRDRPSGTEIHDLTAGNGTMRGLSVLLLTIFVLPHRHRLIAATVAGPASYFVPFPGDCRARLWHEPYSTGTTRPALSRLVFYRRIRSAQPTLLTKTANRTLAYSLVPIGDSSNSIPTPIGSLLHGTARKPRN
jgi:hypothetical protein